MNNLSTNLNFTSDVNQAPDRAVKIDRCQDIAYYDTLCLYCADNNIDLLNISNCDFDSAVHIMENYGTALTDNIIYYWWID